MEVVKMALLPANDSEFDGEDMDGETRGGNDAAQLPTKAEKSGWVTLVPSSRTIIDLLKLENGKKLAHILNHFDNVPAGTCNKIRLLYRNVRVVLNDESEVKFHPTAHSHLDLHFVGVTNAIGFQDLQDRSIVEAIGRFASGLVFTAKEFAITFPDERSGFVDNGWRLDNTFVIRQMGDNVVFPKPNRSAAYYDNLFVNAVTLTRDPLHESDIDNNVHVRARGYTKLINNVPVGIDAYRISIGT